MPSTAAIAAATTPAPVVARATLSSDFDTFLKLLTAQIRNQDPLKPMDPAEYTQQLATFAEVEQSMIQTQRIEQLTTMLASGGLERGAALLDREASFADGMRGVVEAVERRGDVFHVQVAGISRPLADVVQLR